MVHFATVVCRSSCEHFVHVPDVLVFSMWLVGVFQWFFSFKDQLWNVFAREENVGDWAEIRCESRSLGVWDSCVCMIRPMIPKFVGLDVLRRGKMQ